MQQQAEEEGSVVKMVEGGEASQVLTHGPRAPDKEGADMTYQQDHQDPKGRTTQAEMADRGEERRQKTWLTS